VVRWSKPRTCRAALGRRPRVALRLDVQTSVGGSRQTSASTQDLVRRHGPSAELLAQRDDDPRGGRRTPAWSFSRRWNGSREKREQASGQGVTAATGHGRFHKVGDAPR
jgi:hypothetical protein